MRLFGSVAYEHIPDQLRKKLDDKDNHMILVGYHTTGGDKLFDPVKRSNSLSVRMEYTVEIEISENVGTTETKRSSRARTMPQRLNHYEMVLDNAKNNQGELVQYALLVEEKPVSFDDARKEPDMGTC